MLESGDRVKVEPSDNTELSTEALGGKDSVLNEGVKSTVMVAKVMGRLGVRVDNIGEMVSVKALGDSVLVSGIDDTAVVSMGTVSDGNSVVMVTLKTGLNEL